MGIAKKSIPPHHGQGRLHGPENGKMTKVLDADNTKVNKCYFEKPSSRTLHVGGGTSWFR